jgi:23S rRNA (uridine2552-2'-O)-methyltransferase
MTRWYKSRKREHFYKEAKKLGYRARSAFKLKQIQDRFLVFSKKDVVVDLGAAPGGWSQVAKEFVGEQGVVVGVDILPVQPLDNVHFIKGDIMEDETLRKIREVLKDDKADVVISDLSPDISGVYSVDQARSVGLCERAFEIAEKLLKPGGNFVCKIFEGEDTGSFIEKVKRRFYIVKRFSPKASRKTSSEIYIIAKSLKTPYSICHLEK